MLTDRIAVRGAIADRIGVIIWRLDKDADLP